MHSALRKVSSADQLDGTDIRILVEWKVIAGPPSFHRPWEVWHLNKAPDKHHIGVSEGKEVVYSAATTRV